VKPALLVIDVQKAYFKPGSAETLSLNQAIEYINAAIYLFREKELPVICIQQVDEAEKIVPGEAGFEVPSELRVLPSDLHIQKTFGNAFTKTSLKDNLDKLDIDTLVITGFCAEYCVLTTYRGAREQAMTPIMLKGALVSGVPENIKFVESLTDIISYGALKTVLKS